jgi:hypothetical protein
MAEDPFDFIKIMMLLFLASIVAMSTPDANASICRNSAVKRQFDREQGYPHGRKGYIVDHVCAIGCTGKDITANMQYQTIEASKKKDRWETTPVGCKLTCNPQNSTKTRQVFNCK